MFTPIFKKGDPLDQENYHPVRILLLIFEIVEKHSIPSYLIYSIPGKKSYTNEDLLA